jgi:hypothetical protein
MPLEEVIARLQNGPIDTVVERSALHHLEAGKRVMEALAELAKGEMECGHCTRGGETYDQFAARMSTPTEEPQG